VEGFSESLADEVARFGITVTIVEPGYFRTDFLDSSSIRYGGQLVEDYADRRAWLRAAFDAHNQQQVSDPAKLAAAIIQLAAREAPPRRFAAGSDAVAAIAAKLERLTAELAAWRPLSVSTDGAF
jgi:NAD(P)-dependent dehydrogenase (short-subunit alcohol dehydrogenase family)